MRAQKSVSRLLLLSLALGALGASFTLGRWTAAPTPPTAAADAERPASPVFTLATGLCADGTLTEVRRSDISALLARDLDVSGQGGLELFGVEGRAADSPSIHVRSIAAYRRARAAGGYANDTTSMAANAWFGRASRTLRLLEEAEVARLSHVSDWSEHLTRLPAAVLPGALPDLEPFPAHWTVADAIAAGAVVVDGVDPSSVRLECNHWGVLLQEVVRADLDGDGLEELLLYRGARVTGGTHGDSTLFVLERDGPREAYRLRQAG